MKSQAQRILEGISKKSLSNKVNEEFLKPKQLNNAKMCIEKLFEYVDMYNKGVHSDLFGTNELRDLIETLKGYVNALENIQTVNNQAD